MTPYGCHNHAERTNDDIVRYGNGNAQNVGYPWVFKTDRQCYYDQQQTDPQCSGCKWKDEQ